MASYRPQKDSAEDPDRERTVESETGVAPVARFVLRGTQRVAIPPAPAPLRALPQKARYPEKKTEMPSSSASELSLVIRGRMRSVSNEAGQPTTRVDRAVPATESNRRSPPAVARGARPKIILLISASTLCLVDGVCTALRTFETSVLGLELTGRVIGAAMSALGITIIVILVRLHLARPSAGKAPAIDSGA